MSHLPTRDALDFTAAVTLGAVLGWTAVTLLRSDEAVPAPSRRRSRLLTSGGRAESQGLLPQRLKEEAVRLAKETGSELANVAVRRLREAVLGGRTARGR